MRLAKADRPDCILLDIMMPDLDGYETCASFKADPQLAAIPILLISATTDVQVVDKAERAGATAVLPSPWQSFSTPSPSPSPPPPSRMLKNPLSPRLLKKVRMQGGVTHLAMGTRRGARRT